MSRSYYSILFIHRQASAPEIAKAYKKLSLKWHPKLSKEDVNVTYRNFCDIAEAYEVLSDPIKRAIYDKFGEDKLKEGFFSEGNLVGGYRFGGNPEEIFEKFFGTDNPFSQIYDTEGKEQIGSIFSHAFGSQNFKGIDPPPVLDVNVECTLNELYNGCSKRVLYKRNVLNKDGRTTREVEETRELEIKKGFGNSSRIVFEKLGNEMAGVANSDLVFHIKEKPHTDFRRKNNDLIYIAKVNLINAICSDPITIVTLDGRKLFVPMDEIISPKTVKLVKGEGMPIHNPKEFTVENFSKPLERGDLYIKFDIIFPNFIAEERKAELRKLI